MAIEFIGDLPDNTREDLEAFAAELERHPWGGPVECRLVAAEPLDSDGPPLAREFERWMTPDEYRDWRAKQPPAGVGTVAGGRVVLSPDGIFTAIVADPTMVARVPLTDYRSAFLCIAAHEVFEVAHEACLQREGWEYPSESTVPALIWADQDAAQEARLDRVRELNGIVLFDEYVADRTRLSITRRLGWPASELDSSPGLVEWADDILKWIPRNPPDVPPRNFWSDWIGLARRWAMTAGRRAAGGAAEGEELRAWADHELIADQGWSTVEGVMAKFYDRPDVERDRLVRIAARRIFEPIESYGLKAWDRGGGSRDKAAE